MRYAAGKVRGAFTVKRRYSVRRNERFQEIRSKSRGYSNDLLVLCALPNELPYARFGFSVSARVGGAVVRNRIKRQLREIMRLRQNQITPGWDIILIARRPILNADYWNMDAACARLLGRAHLLNQPAPSSDGATDSAGEPDPNR